MPYADDDKRRQRQQTRRREAAASKRQAQDHHGQAAVVHVGSPKDRDAPTSVSQGECSYPGLLSFVPLALA